MSTKMQQWTTATLSLLDACESVRNIVDSYGKYAEIRVIDNSRAEHPIKIQNPELDNPFNWQMMYSTLGKFSRTKFFNETELDLYFNWYPTFGTEEAIEAYEERGEVIEGLMKTPGIAHVIPFELARKLRLKYDGYDLENHRWVTEYQPKQGISYWIPDPSVGKVMVVYVREAGRKYNAKLAKENLRNFVAAYMDVLMNSGSQEEAMSAASNA